MNFLMILLTIQLLFIYNVPRRRSTGTNFASVQPKGTGKVSVTTASLGSGTASWFASRRPRERHVAPLLLVGPIVVFFLVVFLIPVGLMIRYSLYKQTGSSEIGADLTIANYVRLFSVDLYRKAMLTTLRVSFLTTLIAVLLGFPMALLMARGSALVSRILTIVVIAPMLVNVVVRAYAWRIILANGDAGILNWTLARLGLGEVRILYTEWAIIVGSVHFFLSTMVLPLAASLGRIDPAVEEAARTLGATGLQVFRRVTLPLSVPGLAAGCTLVFSLTASSFVIPALLGGNFAKMLGPLVQEQILSVFDWPFGATLATALIAAVMIVNFLCIGIVERRYRARSKGAA